MNCTLSQLEYCSAMEVNLCLSHTALIQRRGMDFLQILILNSKSHPRTLFFYMQNKLILIHFRMFFCHFGNSPTSTKIYHENRLASQDAPAFYGT